MSTDQKLSSHILANNQSAADQTRKELGNVLKNARIHSGLSPESIAQSTKISLHFILALEAGDLRALPGQVFGRGFIKNIARLMRISDQELLRLYDSCWTVEGELPQPRKTIQQYQKSPSSSSLAPKKSVVDVPSLPIDAYLRKIRDALRHPVLFLALGSFALIVALVVFFSRHQDIPTPVVQKTTETSNAELSDIAPHSVARSTRAVPSIVDAEAPSDIDPLNENTENLAPAIGTTTNKTIEDDRTNVAAAPAVSSGDVLQSVPTQPATFEQVLELNVLEPVNVKLRFDNEKQTTKKLKVDTYRFTFQDTAELMVYDAASVEIKFNGRSLGSLGTKGRIRRLHFQAQEDLE